VPTTVANQLAVAKEVWDSDQLEKQFYDEYPFLEMIEKKQRVVIGKQAQVPLWSQRAGGTTVATSAGTTSIETAGAEVVNQAFYNMAYNYFPVGIQVGAMNENAGGNSSVGDSYERMITGGLSNVRNHVLRQFLTGHGRIAQAAAGGASTTVQFTSESDLNVAAGEVSGTHALQMGWIVPDDHLQIGTLAAPATLTADGVVSAVNESITAPTVTIDDSITTTTGNHFARLRSNGASVATIESAGLVTIAGSSGNVVGNIDGSSNSFWNPAEVVTTQQLPDLALLLRLARRVTKKTGRGDVFALLGLAQLDNIYQFLQTQVRFTGDKEIGAGGSEQVKWRGMTLHAFPHVPDSFLFFLDMDVLEIVLGKFTKPMWMSDIHGAGMLRDPRSTLFEDTIMYALGLAARRRNSMASATRLLIS
jgi:hypothetical protein